MEEQYFSSPDAEKQERVREQLLPTPGGCAIVERLCKIVFAGAAGKI